VKTLRENNPVDNPEIVATNDQRTRSVVEIQGKQNSIKFTDNNWQDFLISVDLNVVPIRTFFNMIGELTDINFVVGDEVTSDVTLRLKDVNWQETFEMVLTERLLMHEVNGTGTVVTIHSNKWIGDHSTSYGTALNAKLTVIDAIKGLEEKTTSIFKLNYTKPASLATQLKEIVALGGSSGEAANSGASFVVDTRTNSIIVQATPNDMTWITSTIETLDKATKQVMIEVFIVEATNNFERQLGSRVGLTQTSTQLAGIGEFGAASLSGTLGDASAIGTVTLGDLGGQIASNAIGSATGGLALLLSRSTRNLRLELMAMETENLVKVISNPKLFIIDNETATITDGYEVPYTTTPVAGASAETQFITAALNVTVTPQIIDDGNIYLDLKVNKDTPGAGTPPPIYTKKIETKLLVADGGVALIGGITKNDRQTSDSGVPFFKDLPFIGNFFKSRKNKNLRDTLYIFIAPTVVK
jgi:type IV pilus assembly protein PilQ